MIQSSLDSSPGTIFQAWESYSDTDASTHQHVMSYAYAKAQGQGNILRAPGLSWAMTSQRYNDIGGFNPFLAPGGGDACFVFDVDESPELSPLPFSWPWWLAIYTARSVPKGPVGYIPVTMTHVNHGGFAGRAYYWRNIAMTLLADDIRSALRTDEQGLLATTNTSLARQLIYVLSRKSLMTDESSMHQVIQEARKQ
ncbi:MAG: hypothetical protein U9Q07_12090, partial [Planctomycetota bacterium]|nr:hypothetical protein [Planctomycetota bacterium]